MEGKRLFLLIKEPYATVAVWSYLRQYICDSLVDRKYVNMADSSFELLAPLPFGMETFYAFELGSRLREAKWPVEPVRDGNTPAHYSCTSFRE